MSVYDEIRAERERQDEKWGGPSHDDQHRETDWCDFIEEHNSKARNGADFSPSYRRRMIEVAALATAAVESFDRRRPRESSRA